MHRQSPVADSNLRSFCILPHLQFPLVQTLQCEQYTLVGCLLTNRAGYQSIKCHVEWSMYLNAVSVSLDCLFLQVANKLVAISGTEEIQNKHTWGGREGPVGFENDKLELKCAKGSSKKALVKYTLHGIS